MQAFLISVEAHSTLIVQTCQYSQMLSTHCTVRNYWTLQFASQGEVEHCPSESKSVETSAVVRHVCAARLEPYPCLQGPISACTNVTLKTTMVITSSDLTGPELASHAHVCRCILSCGALLHWIDSWQAQCLKHVSNNAPLYTYQKCKLQLMRWCDNSVRGA